MSDIEKLKNTIYISNTLKICSDFVDEINITLKDINVELNGVA